MLREIKSPTAAKIIAESIPVACQINTLAQMIHEDADAHGLWDDFRREMGAFADLPDDIRLRAVRYYATHVVAGEVSELRSASEDKQHYAEEAADVVISMLSTCVELGIDIGAAVASKMEVNRMRPHKHGKETCYVQP